MRYQSKRVTEHCAVALVVAQRHRTGATFGQGGADFSDFGLQAVAALKIAAILADSLSCSIAGNRFESAVDLDDGVPTLTHVRDQHTITDVVQGQPICSQNGIGLVRSPVQAVPLLGPESKIALRWALVVVSVMRHGASRDRRRCR